ncbi:hypothetical protein [Nannocystis punicea]|uniref:Uncharacterized protein n=1 Tax=Nannocystis punicea TaxID=2995304 RepID=A0ABY7GWG5_9BACT|nr:hypothetical protein [Nannocystis poenicansa]WAS91293.1 hypothetical protein O0S08_34330 [Nannocystis poenicansa]
MCEKTKLQPSVFHGWQRALFERPPQVFVESRATPAETVTSKHARTRPGVVGIGLARRHPTPRAGLNRTFAAPPA